MATRYHHGNLRAALLECAERVVRAKGVAALSLRELAREVGVSHAAPRRHFPDRQALLDALALDGFERLESTLQAAVDEAAGKEVGERVAALARAYVGFATEHAALLELMFAAKHQPGADTLQVASSRAFAPTFELLQGALDAGEIVADDPMRVAMVVFPLVHGLASLANAGMFGDLVVDDVVTAASEQLLQGLRPRPS